MRRSGGWILALVTIGAMAAGAWLALRPVLTRETVNVVFIPTGVRGPTNDALLRGARLALHEANSRAGMFRVELKERPGWNDTVVACVTTNEYRDAPPDIPCFAALEVDPSILGPQYPQFRASPSFADQGIAAAAWVSKSNCARPFLLRESQGRGPLIEIAFKSVAAKLGMELGREAVVSPDRARLISTVMASNPDLIFYSGEEAPYATSFEIFSALRQEGFAGKLVMADADPEVSFLVAPDRLVEGSYLVSPFSPADSAFAESFRAFAGYPAGVHAYYGYFAMKSALESIEQAGSKDPMRVFRAALKLPYFDAQGSTTVHFCALYVARGGRFEFVENLR